MEKSKGYYFGVFAIIIPSLFLIFAFIVSEGYNPYLQTISKLGIHSIGQYPFFIGIFSGGILLTLFFYITFSNVDKSTPYIYYARIFGLLSGFGQIGVAVFPDYDDLFFEITHYLSAAIFFTGMAMSILFFSLYLKNFADNNNINRILSYNGFLVDAISILHLILAGFKSNMMLFGIEYKLSVIMQKITVGGMFIWFILLFLSKNVIKENYFE